MAKILDENFTRTLIDWYRKHRRDLPWRRDKVPYHVWVSEIMLQQTRVEAVREYYCRFMEALPTIKDLAEAEEENLLKLWQGLGYYNRVRNLQKAAQVIQGEFAAVFPQDFDSIRALPGIGDYTAGAIASICFDMPTAAVDGNVLRVMARLRNDPKDIKSAATKREVAAFLADLYPGKRKGSRGGQLAEQHKPDNMSGGAHGPGNGPCSLSGNENGDFTQALIELGALVCVPNGAPQCQACPVMEFCQAREAGTALELPVKSAKRPRRREERTVLILTCGDKVAVRKRPPGSLLGNLFEFPQVPRHLTAGAAVSQAEAWGCRPTGLTRSAKYRHIFTHVEWDMIGYYITCGAEGTGVMSTSALQSISETTGDAMEKRTEQPADPVETTEKKEVLQGKEGTPAENMLDAASFRWVTREEMENEVPLPSAFQYFWE